MHGLMDPDRLQCRRFHQVAKMKVSGEKGFGAKPAAVFEHVAYQLAEFLQYGCLIAVDTLRS